MMIEETTRTDQVRLAGLSDVGVMRSENQDRYLMHVPDDESMSGSRGTLLAVADGMGGLLNGSLASSLVIDALKESYFAGFGDAADVLTQSVAKANRAVFDKSLELGVAQSMGSTLTAMAVLRGEVCIAQVGDSRAYHYRAGRLRQVTKDHSLFRELQDSGQGGVDPRVSQSQRNILTRGLGLYADVRVDLFEIQDIEPGDIFLLSSDGLHDVVGDAVIQSCLETYDDLDELCQKLVERAREAGGPDNITLVVAKLAGSSENVAPLSLHPVDLGETSSSLPPSRAGLLLLAILLSFLAGVGVTTHYSKPADDPGFVRRMVSEIHGKLIGLLDSMQDKGDSKQSQDETMEIRRLIERGE